MGCITEAHCLMHSNLKWNIKLKADRKLKTSRNDNDFLLAAAVFIFTMIIIISGCCSSRKIAPRPVAAGEGRTVANMGYAIQAGAFSSAQNAARLTELLRKQGIEAYYYVFKENLYKVRFGNFPTREAAKNKATEVKDAGIIDEFYIVSPEQYAVNFKEGGPQYLRSEIVRSAQTFLGVPYLWGGNSQDGLDCSGFTVAVFRLSGLNLPRLSHEQFELGSPVDRSGLTEGDLVFFRTKKGDNTISHVGIYIGGDQFIHAPGAGKKICVESLKREYYLRRFAGGRKCI